MVQYEGYIGGLRISGLSANIRAWAIDCHLNLLYIQSEKGLLRERVFFKVEGEEAMIDTFVQGLNDWANS